MSKSSTTGYDNLTAAILAALAGPPDDAAAALAAVRDVYTAARETTTDPGELDPVEQIVGEALAARTGDESRADNEKQAPGLADRLMAAFEPAHSITAWIGKPTPEPVLWERGSMRANGENNEERECSAYCSVGEPALLSAPGRRREKLPCAGRRGRRRNGRAARKRRPRTTRASDRVRPGGAARPRRDLLLRGSAGAHVAPAP